MAHLRYPAGYSSSVPLIDATSISEFVDDDVHIWRDEPTILVQKTLQPVGYVDDNFPSKYYDRPKFRFQNRTSQPLITGPMIVPMMQQETPVAVQKRVIDIINQCRYLSTKRGMDKREIIESIKRDQIEGTNYISRVGLSAVCSYPSVNPLGMERSMYPPWTGPPSEYEKSCTFQQHAYNNSQGDVPILHAHPAFIDPVPDFTSRPATAASFGRRPPTRRTSIRTPISNRNGNCPRQSARDQAVDSSESSGESDYDCSETSELISNLQMKQGITQNRGSYENTEIPDSIKLAEETVSDTNILPSRKSGTHNFSLLKTGCSSQSQVGLEFNEEEISTYTNESSEDEGESTSEEEPTEYDQDPKDLLLKKRYEASRKSSVSSVFGNLDQFDKMLSDSDDQLIMQQHPSP